jgi:hypothetical protein
MTTKVFSVSMSVLLDEPLYEKLSRQGGESYETPPNNAMPIYKEELKDRGKELGHVDIYETADHK